MKHNDLSENEFPRTSIGEGFTPLIGGKELFLGLGYQTGAAFRQALRRGQLPIEVFSIPNRRGKFALRADFNNWLKALKPSGVEKKGGTD